MPIGPIGSTGPIGAICPNELMPIGPIGSIGPIGAICTLYANWANWFHGPNWYDMSHKINANWANWFHRPNWRDMYYVCQLDQLVPYRAQLGPIWPNGIVNANWANWFHRPNWCDMFPIWREMYYVCQLGQLVPRAQLVRYVLGNGTNWPN